MSEKVEGAIEVALAQIAELEREAAEHKKTVNGLCKLLSRPPMFPDVGSSTSTILREDEFYGKPLATAVQEVLDRRKMSGQGSATVNDIYDMLVRGGFHFATKNAENAKRNLYQNLGKNSKFHKLPNGTYGLTEWYPNVRKGRDGQPADDTNGKIDAKVEAEASQDEEQAILEAKKTFDETNEETEPEVVGGRASKGKAR